MRYKHRHHAGRETAIGNDVDSGFLRLVVQCKLGVDDFVVAAQIAEICFRGERRACEAGVQFVDDATKNRIVFAHQIDDGAFIRDVELQRDGLVHPDC